ncbi:MAG: hypothetical protein QOF67_1297 [Mycobacterium sp.]|nr:hypothetical protein [Mycobacterium sp.]
MRLEAQSAAQRLNGACAPVGSAAAISVRRVVVDADAIAHPCSTGPVGR